MRVQLTLNSAKAYAQVQLANYRTFREQVYLNRAIAATNVALSLYRRRGATC